MDFSNFLKSNLGFLTPIPSIDLLIFWW